VPFADHHISELEGLVSVVKWSLARIMFDSPQSASTRRSRHVLHCSHWNDEKISSGHSVCEIRFSIWQSATQR